MNENLPEETEASNLNTTKTSIDTTNSTDVPLDASGVFTGVASDTSNRTTIIVNVITDQNGTLTIQFSGDTLNWDISYDYNVVANTTLIKKLPTENKYARVIFTNTSLSDQTFIRLWTLLGHQQVDDNRKFSVFSRT